MFSNLNLIPDTTIETKSFIKTLHKVYCTLLSAARKLQMQKIEHHFQASLI